MKIRLRDYQKDAVKFAFQVPKCQLLMRVGSGKTICAMGALKVLFKYNKITKAIIACTKSSVSVFKEDFKDKANLDVKLVESVEDLVKFYEGDEKVCLIKHSMFQKAGNDAFAISALARACSGETTALVIDEAHKIQNPTGIAQEAYHRLHFLFDRVILLTATPYSSCLTQFYGLICLIYPNLWKNELDFKKRYIEELTIRNPRTGRPVRKEKVRYKNLGEFRKKIEPFTFFYFPPIPLVYQDHKSRLGDYSDYNALCRGILSEEDLKKFE